MHLKRKEPDHNYKNKDKYVWPIMGRKIDEYKKSQQSSTTSYRMVILDLSDETKKKKARKGHGGEDI